MRDLLTESRILLPFVNPSLPGSHQRLQLLLRFRRQVRCRANEFFGHAVGRLDGPVNMRPVILGVKRCESLSTLDGVTDADR